MVSRSKSKNDARLARLSSTSAYSAANFSTLSPAPVESKKLLSFGSSKSMLVDNSLQPIEHDDLKQGSLYIVKIRNVSVALFQGWDDDMCCFAVLRSDSTPMRWSEARYIPGDFDAYDAFDDAGNPPVHLWTRHLRVNVPTNWFSIFEEARRKQRDWVTEQNQEPYYYPTEEYNGNGYPSSAVNDNSNSSSNNSKNNGETPQENDKEKPAKKDYAAGEEESKDEQASANGDKAPSSGSSESDEKEPVTPAVTDNDAHPVSNNSSSVVNSSVVAKETAAATAPPPVPKSFEAGEMTRLFTVSNIGFPHNGDQFSIQSSGYQQEAPLGTPTPMPLNGHSKKDAADGSNNAIKTKRRSVHSLFRGSK